MIRELKGRLNAAGANNNPGTILTQPLGLIPGVATRQERVKVLKPDMFYRERAKFDNWAL
jgi:hypothetical protein